MKTTPLVVVLVAVAVLLAVVQPTTAQQGAVTIGEINSFSGIGVSP